MHSAIKRTSVVLAMTLAVTACSSPTATPTIDCQDWCGGAWATVAIANTTWTINGGGCLDEGSDGINVRIGDWQGLQGLSDYIELTGYRPGGPTPVPAPTLGPDDHPGPTVDGSVNGQPFVLLGGTVTFTSANGGVYSGTDANGAGAVSGTFSCG
jgi:hypothetical protein